MILFAILPGDAPGILGFVSFLYVLLSLLLLWLVRPLELKLIAVGLLTAVLAAWVAQMPAAGAANVQAGPGPPAAVGRVATGGESAGALGRVAVLLVLGGLAVGILGRRNHAAPPPDREDARRDRPA